MITTNRKRIFSKAAAVMALTAAAAVLLSGCASEKIDNFIFSRLAEKNSSEQVDSGQSSEAVVEQAPEPEATEEPAAEFVLQQTDELRITEYMTDNKAYIAASDNSFYPWIELYNNSDRPVDLSCWKIAAAAGSEAADIMNAPVLQPGEYTVIYDTDNDIEQPHAVIHLENIELCLQSESEKTQDMLIEKLKANRSAVLSDNGEYLENQQPAPGFADTTEGRSLFNQSRAVPEALSINEVQTKNNNTSKNNQGEYSDWVEFRNNSSETIELSEYTFTNKLSEQERFRFPEQKLYPGNVIRVWCSGEIPENTYGSQYAGFKLDQDKACVYLFRNGELVDYMACGDIPADYSKGRQPESGAWYYYNAPTPEYQNSGGFENVSNSVSSDVPEGIYENISELKVALQGQGIIYYTTDGSQPDRGSKIYSEPIVLTGTTVIRTFAAEESCAPGKESSFSYIINEGHSLPVLSIIAKDKASFSYIYWNSSLSNPMKWDVEAEAALFENGTAFHSSCALYMKGWTSLDYGKKSLGIDFTGRFGSGAVDYDVFGTGNTHYEQLSVRAGQDYLSAVIRTELLEELALSASDSIVTQHSKYCVLYVNGEYRGIYCIKDEISKTFYADLTGTDKSTVVSSKPTAVTDEYRQEVLDFIKNNDLADEDNYAEFRNVFDIDELIDWMIMQGYSANSDIKYNLRYYRTAGGLWQIAYYDLDWAFSTYENAKDAFGNVLYAPWYGYYSELLGPLLKNESFMEQFIMRAAELLGGPLSDEAALAKADELTAVILPELERDREKWGLSMSTWEIRLNELKNYITRDGNEVGWAEYCMTRILEKLSADETLTQRALEVFHNN